MTVVNYKIILTRYESQPEDKQGIKMQVKKKRETVDML